MPKLNIAVIFGGRSGEHEVSLRSAKQVMEALDEKKYNVVPIAITKKGQWLEGELGEKYMEMNYLAAEEEGGVSLENSQSLVDTFQSQGKLVSFCQGGEDTLKIDLALPICHGSFGEDGKLQGMLEMLNIPYAFSGTLASALAMHKRKTKIVAKAAGLKIAKDVSVEKDRKYNLEKIIDKLNFPIVVKPSELGSSVGTNLVQTKEELEAAIQDAFQYGEEVLLEQFIKGRELTVTIMGDKKPKALPVIEIIPEISGWFDYKAKYKKGGSKEVCPAEIPEEIVKKVQRYAVKVFKAVGCKDLARADFIWSEKDDKLYFLEINTIPGMTGTSLAPQAAATAGLNFSQFLDKIIQGVVKRNKK